jgi:hypothetical protein
MAHLLKSVTFMSTTVSIFDTPAILLPFRRRTTAEIQADVILLLEQRYKTDSACRPITDVHTQTTLDGYYGLRETGRPPATKS